MTAKTQAAKLATFAASLVAKCFNPPWLPKWSQLGAL